MAKRKAKHAELVDKAMTAISDLASDTSVGTEQSISSLQDLRSEIDIRIEAMESDLEDIEDSEEQYD